MGAGRETTTWGCEYFERFGDISDCVMKDRATGLPRDFVTYASQIIADRVVLRHIIDGKEVEAMAPGTRRL